MADNRKTFDKELLDLKNHILNMGERVEEALEKAIIALVDNDQDLADEVILQDTRIDDMETITDDKVFNLITQQQPVARDLRIVLTAIKMNASLERMGDLARNIAKIAKRFERCPSEAACNRIKEMGTIVQSMVHRILQAYLEGDVIAAKAIAQEDDKVDTLYKNFLNSLFSAVNDNRKTAEQATQLAFVGRHLERIGDHVTNIAELLVYLEEAKKFNLNK